MFMLTTFNALAERNRFDIVELLRDGPRSVNEIAARLHLRQPQASKHLRVLADAGLVLKQTRAQFRIYSLREPAFDELESWLSSFSGLWEERVDTLQRYVREMRNDPSRKGDK